MDSVILAGRSPVRFYTSGNEGSTRFLIIFFRWFRGLRNAFSMVLNRIWDILPSLYVFRHWQQWPCRPNYFYRSRKARPVQGRTTRKAWKVRCLTGLPPQVNLWILRWRAMSKRTEGFIMSVPVLYCAPLTWIGLIRSKNSPRLWCSCSQPPASRTSYAVGKCQCLGITGPFFSIAVIPLTQKLHGMVFFGAGSSFQYVSGQQSI